MASLGPQTRVGMQPTPQRRGIGGFLKLYWPDLLTMAAMGAVGLGVYEAPPAPNRVFPITFQDGEIVYPEFGYPLRKNIIPIYAAALLAALVPVLCFAVFQIRKRSFQSFSTATMGVLISLITAALFQVFLKWLIGGLRPHFLAVCKPNVTAPGTGFHQIYYDRSVCTGDRHEINDSLESFPSGHSTAAWAGFLFLSLWLNAHLKIFANARPAYWKLILFFAPLLGATLICGSLTIDEFHHYTDTIAGGIIGIFCAFASYRMHYHSIYDWRVNHIPLPIVGSNVAGTHPLYGSHALRTNEPFGVNEIASGSDEKALPANGARHGV